MNYTDDTTPRPEPVPGGGPAQGEPMQSGPAQEGPVQSGPMQGEPAQGGPAQGGQYESPQYQYQYGSAPQGGSAPQSGPYGSNGQSGPYDPNGPGGPYYQGPYEPPVPPEVKKWNWGAFALNWIWGCGNGAYLALLCLIPFFNIVWIFVCGVKGNEWAWKSGKFKDLDTFLTTQRTWNIAGLIMFIINIAYIVIIIVMVFNIVLWGSLSLFDQGGYGYDFEDYNWS
ncbi:MAG: hypothetical protein LBJ91_05510 [Clostridiales Family XIII bacterium]|jgi:hypothetical protein|nr:hypothetical protein [Clostridiales Family XIII bacterium]